MEPKNKKAMTSARQIGPVRRAGYCFVEARWLDEYPDDPAAFVITRPLCNPTDQYRLEVYRRRQYGGRHYPATVRYLDSLRLAVRLGRRLAAQHGG